MLQGVADRLPKLTTEALSRCQQYVAAQAAGHPTLCSHFNIILSAKLATKVAVGALHVGT